MKTANDIVNDAEMDAERLRAVLECRENKEVGTMYASGVTEWCCIARGDSPRQCTCEGRCVTAPWSDKTYLAVTDALADKPAHWLDD